VASERQILANRRNAQKSTGPKTALGKKRSSKNAYNHGLSLPMRNVGSQKQLEELSRLYAGDASDPKILALAERAADAQADLMRVRNVKTAMLERALMKAQGGNRAEPELLDSSRPLLIGEGEEEQSFVNAVRHILPEQIKINRYEKRAASRRDRAIHELTSMKTANKK
jgi:hypothetical protein